ncbi:unnamed protein product [Adineta ricciae]|uniref:Uncharacterized protein n=1 Tax=Adineta ricciae TaxID=249248 RepID=A0A815WZQ4_ADIRI|nr:unnamed protein product [Adineta ricciae]CAF1551057.1 unnamed protein product [Adineta ricciae]
MNIKQCWQKGIYLIILYFTLILLIFELVQPNYLKNILTSLPIIGKSERVVSISWNCPLNLSQKTYPYYNASWCTQEFLAGTYQRKLKLRELLYLTDELQSTRKSISLITCEKELFQQYRQARSSTDRPDVIVYLTQKQSHTVYKRDVFVNTQKSLDMLFQHYSAIYNADILLLTNKNAFNDDDRAILSRNGTRKNLRFFEIAGPYWDYIPECINQKIDLQYENSFKIGYRQMIRLYSTVIPDLLHNLGYEWMMRMDEESRYVTTPSPLNELELFENISFI